MTRANRKNAVGISLFPFLAVLICTMGSLIMLLVMLMQQARANAFDANRERMQHATQEEIAREENLRTQMEDETWRAEVLEQQRQELQQHVSDRRLKLAHLEQHIRDLDAQWKSLQA